MLPGWLIVGVSFAYLLTLFAIAYVGDRRADQGRSIIANPWTYGLSLAVYCTAWTYFGSVGRAASGGIWFLPTYLGPTLGMALAWLVANDDRVDLLVTDQNMPGLSGIDVAREVVRIRPGLRVAIMSGYVSDELREQARLCGVHEVLAKLNRVDDLVEAVRSLLPAD